MTTCQLVRTDVTETNDKEQYLNDLKTFCESENPKLIIEFESHELDEKSNEAQSFQVHFGSFSTLDSDPHLERIMSCVSTIIMGIFPSIMETAMEMTQCGTCDANFDDLPLSE